jgi:hypothetical protein
MNLIEVVILVGVQCLGPVEVAQGTTNVGKVPCAVLIRLNEETGKVAFTPPSAASNPEVIAMLMKPGEAAPPEAADPDETPLAEGDAQALPAAPQPQLKGTPPGKAGENARETQDGRGEEKEARRQAQ